MFIVPVPSRPIITSTLALENSISILWFQAYGDRVDYYLIDYSYQDQCDHSFQYEVINHTEVGNKQVTLAGLQEFSNYLINITAVNSQGRRSTNLTITTLASGQSTLRRTESLENGNSIHTDHIASHVVVVMLCG